QFCYVNYPAGIHDGAVAYTQPINPNSGVGVGLNYLNSGVMKRTNEQGEELGTFGAAYADLNISAALRLAEPLLLGAGIAGVYGNIDTFFSLGLATNLGIGYELSPYNIRVGLTASNLGWQIKPFGDSRNPLPIEFGLGAVWEPVPAVNLNFTVGKPLDNRFNFRLGVEGWLNQYLVLRGGYNSLGSDLSDGSGGDIFAGFATGLGLCYQRYQIDYSFIPMGRMGISHRLSFGLSL
ncbi:MAG: PorV/PorQ family protein, partial [bacterium]